LDFITYLYWYVNYFGNGINSRIGEIISYHFPPPPRLLK